MLQKFIHDLHFFQTDDAVTGFNDDIFRIAEDDLKVNLRPFLDWLNLNHKKSLLFEDLKVSWPSFVAASFSGLVSALIEML